ncbi:sulfur carrier protein ThiS [Leuconostoc holzapfelii]|uniref:Sulfur carrier protein ThiS n=1 Tax=Leuconostoc holzapfelii TaxID=434464 RepID=A0A846ZGY4_9LACO|nr:sulfur carrier protein ThiS [Leuconostoc holzapfelii]NKZ18460.1 sulfur carrier protein ThiS [Leuconostoc holzapfelii]
MITVNGKQTDNLVGRTIRALLGELSLEDTRVVVERNGQIVARDAYETTLLVDQDEIEVISFVGGG